MADFTPIETQEAFDEAISKRLERERKKIEGFTSPADVQKLKDSHLEELKALQSQIEELQKKPEELQEQIDKLTKQNQDYATEAVKYRIVHEAGLPYESRKFLTGETEEEIKESAEDLKKIFDSQKKAVPLASVTPKSADTKEQAYQSLLKKLSKEE